jgi:hypothetical protein
MSAGMPPGSIRGRADVLAAQEIVVAAVLAVVVALLLVEGAYVGLQLRRAGMLRVGLDRGDEEALAVREEQRQVVEEAGDRAAARVPEARRVLRLRWLWRGGGSTGGGGRGSGGGGRGLGRAGMRADGEAAVARLDGG